MAGALRRIRWFIVALVLMTPIVAATPAGASCAEPVSVRRAVDEAGSVFVGTVTDLDYGGRVATFSVDEVWKGSVSGTVVVSGGPTLTELEDARARGQDVVTSVDRTYEMGGRYLVVSYRSDGPVHLDNACSATQPFSAELETFRPDSAHTPAGSEAGVVTGNGPSIFAWVGLAALTLAVAGGLLLLLRHTHRHGRSGPAAV